MNTYLIRIMIGFQKAVSKGGRFNQIYVPRRMERLIEVGDEVEVRLVRKNDKLFYSKGLKKLSEFKEGLIKDVFSFLDENHNLSRIFAVGSFLTEKISYNDIDLVLIAAKRNGNFEETVYNKLIEKFNLKFHVLVIDEKRFEHLLKICPVTKSMFSQFVCNKSVEIPDEVLIDKNHIKFLLMMPRDLLEIKLSSRVFFDNLRRLVTIERFLRNKSLDITAINNEVGDLLNNQLYKKLRNNEEIEEKSVGLLRKTIKAKLAIIEKLVENGEKQRYSGTD